MPTENFNEKETVLKALADISYFTNLYEYYADKIYSYCYFRLYNKETAQDITSDIFLKALEAFNNNKYKYDENFGFSAWLYRIAHNAVIDHYKKYSTRNVINLDESNPVKSDMDVAQLEQEMDKEKQLDEVKKIITDFDDQTQSIFVLKFKEEYSFAQISKIIEEKESTIKMRYYRALEYIQKKLNVSK